MKGIILLLSAILIACATGSFSQGNWVLPKYEKTVLKNGLTVYLMEHHEVPLISMVMVTTAGSVLDEQESGLAYMTAHGLGFGTSKYTKSEIDSKIDSVGATIDHFVDAQRAGLSAQFAVKDQGLVWSILEEMIKSPSFDAEVFEKERARMIQDLMIAKESPRSVIDSYWAKFIYGDHPYGNPIAGVPVGLVNITRADLQEFYKKHYTSGASAIIVVGDFKASEMKQRITGMFGGWKTNAVVKSTLPEMDSKFTSSKVMLVNKSDSRETRFYIGGNGVPRNHPDYVGIQVINTILGGRFTSWLNTELRVNSGLSYGARSNFACYKLNGSFYMSSFTSTENTEKAIDLALSVLDSLHKTGPDPKTLESAKNYILGGFAPDYETASQLAMLLSDFHVYGINEQFINTFSAQVADVDMNRAKELIRKFFPRENLQFLIIGKSEVIAESVKKYGVVMKKEITSPGY